jgi:hypothetical protein
VEPPNKAFYFEIFYPFQDQVLRVLTDRMGLSLTNAIEGAQSKAAGIFPADLARLLCSATREDWEVIRWIEAPQPEQFVADLQKLGESLILGG